jgi:hypothetical protein
MHYSLLILGLLFLWNPEVTIFDLFPDFIGCLLIAKAIAPLEPLSSSAESAGNKFRKLAAISGIKTAALFPMMTLFSTEKEVTMLFTAGFAILTAIYLIPAFSDLFATVTYFADRSQTSVKGTAFLRGFTILSILLRYAFAFFPETVYVNVDESASVLYGQSIYPWEPYRMGMTVLAVLFSLIVGIAWLIAILSYVKRLKRHRAFNDGIALDLATVSIPFGKQMLAATNPTLLLLVFASFATVSFHIDGLPILPAALSPLLILIAVFYVKKPLALGSRYLVLPTVSFCFGLYSHFTVNTFSKACHDHATIDFDPYTNAFLKPFVTETVSALLQAACFLFCVLPILRKLIATERPSLGERASVFTAHDKREQLRLSFLAVTFTVFTVLYGIGKSVAYWFFYRSHGGRFLATGVGVAIGVLAWYLMSCLRQRLQDVYEN